MDSPVLHPEPAPYREALLEPVASSRYLVGQMVWLAIWATVTGIGLWLRPAAEGHGTHQELGLPPCPSVLLFDRPCPGCGLTTSWSALLHGNWDLAFRAHPLGPILYLLFTVSAGLAAYGLATRKRFNTYEPRFNRVVGWAAMVFLVFGLVRMAVSPRFADPQERALARFSTHPAPDHLP